MSAVQQQMMTSRENIYTSLMTAEPVSPNHHWLARILASWMVGESALPDYLGLLPEQFSLMCQKFFPTADIPHQALSGITIDFERMPERDDLIVLLEADARNNSDETEWVTGLIVAACLGLDHLWQDLGVWSRPDLTDLMNYNFPTLAERNNKNMKWKKFLYKQMCEAEGLYVCRSPSCEVCADYQDCFDVGDH